MLRPALATLALVLAACASTPPPPPVAAQSCPATLRVATEADLEEFDRRGAACNDQACRDDVRADYRDYAITFEQLATMVETRRAADEDSALAELREVERHACACKDAPCATHVQKEFEAWAKRHAETKGSQAQADQAGKIAEHISECMAKAMAGP